MFSSLFLQFMC